LIVLDSSVLIAWHNDRDAHHKAATSTMGKVAAGKWGEALLPEYVFLETVTVVAARRGLSAAGEVARVILGARDVEFVPCSPYFGRALDVFRTQRGTELSFADSAIVAIARDRGAAHVATFDDDFRAVRGLAVVPA